MANDLDIIWMYKTPLTSFSLAKLVNGIADEGWISEPDVVACSPNSVTLRNLSFYFRGRFISDNAASHYDSDVVARIFHVSYSDQILFSGLDTGRPIALGFNYDFVPGAPSDTSTNLFEVIFESDLHSIYASGYHGLILGRFYLIDDPDSEDYGSWSFSTDCSCFTAKYFRENGLPDDYRIAPMQMGSDCVFLPNKFLLMKSNTVIKTKRAILQEFPSGNFIDVTLDSTDGVLLPINSHGEYFAVGFPRVVDTSLGSIESVPLSILGRGSTLSDAINACHRDLQFSSHKSVSVFHPPIAIVKYSSSRSELIPFDSAGVSFLARDQLGLSFRINDTVFTGQPEMVTQAWGVPKSLQVNLGSMDPATVGGSSNVNNHNIGVRGRLPIALGGTGSIDGSVQNASRASSTGILSTDFHHQVRTRWDSQAHLLRLEFHTSDNVFQDRSMVWVGRASTTDWADWAQRTRQNHEGHWCAPVYFGSHSATPPIGAYVSVLETSVGVLNSNESSLHFERTGLRVFSSSGGSNQPPPSRFFSFLNSGGTLLGGVWRWRGGTLWQRLA